MSAQKNNSTKTKSKGVLEVAFNEDGNQVKK